MIEADNFTQIFMKMLLKCHDKPEVIAKPRGMETRALIGHTMKLTNPRDRILFVKGRKYSLVYGLAEFIWYMSGMKDLEFIQIFAPSMKNFSDDGTTVRSGYGYKIARKFMPGDYSQIDYVIDKLKHDKDSRQAIIMIRDFTDTEHDIKLSLKSKDIPCTLYLHFQILKNRLNCIVAMRSQDLMVGKLYDVFTFTMIHEWIYIHLKQIYKTLQLGDFIMFDDNVHIYDRWYKKGNNKVLQIRDNNEVLHPYAMPKMQLVDMEFFVKTIKSLAFGDEHEIPLMVDFKSKYWQDIYKVFKYHFTKDKSQLLYVHPSYTRCLRMEEENGKAEKA